jgi:hypothetical protein
MGTTFADPVAESLDAVEDEEELESVPSLSNTALINVTVASLKTLSWLILCFVCDFRVVAQREFNGIPEYLIVDRFAEKGGRLSLHCPLACFN